MSAPIDLGDTYQYRFTVVNSATGVDVPTNPGSFTASIVTLADGSSSPVTPTNSGPGLYDVAYTPSAEGLYLAVGVATGGFLGSAVETFSDAFTVEQPRLLVGVDEAVTHLRATGVLTGAADREQVRWLCQVSTDAVERDLGRVLVPRTVVETLDGGRAALLLTSTPVLSVTSVVELGTTRAAGDYTLDVRSGLLLRGTPQAPGCWAGGRLAVVVTYRAGALVAPAVARAAALDGVRQMWEAGVQVRPTSGDFGAAGEPFGVGSLLSDVQRRAYDALRAPGFA